MLTWPPNSRDPNPISICRVHWTIMSDPWRLQSLDVSPADTRVKCVTVVQSGGDKSMDDLF